MRTQQAQSRSSWAICILAAAVTAGCDPGSEVAAIEADVPPAARIGNVASADLKPVGDSAVSGTATFADVDDGLLIDLNVMGISGGRHSLYLHEDGDCSASDASAQHDARDLGDLTAGADGVAKLTLEDPELALIGQYGVVGRAVVVHRESDDPTSEPGGNAGERVACGVIKWGPEISPDD